MKTIEQLRREGAAYAISKTCDLMDRLEPIPPATPLSHVERRMAIETALELAFLAGFNATRGGVQ